MLLVARSESLTLNTVNALDVDSGKQEARKQTHHQLFLTNKLFNLFAYLTDIDTRSLMCGNI